MLTRVDRIQVATPDVAAAASAWVDLLGAVHHADDVVSALAARRSQYRLGEGWLEFLAPDADGPVSKALAARGGGHLFAVGFACDDVDELVLRFVERGHKVAVEGGQAFLDEDATGGHGLRVVASAEQDLDPVGRCNIFEVTNLVANAEMVAVRYAEAFGLHPSSCESVESEEYGFAGSVLLFDPDYGRLEVASPSDPDKPMGRFLRRWGETLYMAFAEASDLEAIQARAGGAVVDKQGLVYLPPKLLGGVFLGLRPSG